MANELVNYDALFAEESARQAASEKGTGAQFLSTQGNFFHYGETPVPENTVYCYILASLHTNVYYSVPFNKRKKGEVYYPDCYAFSEDGENMAPHSEAINPCSATCKECKWDKFGTADVGAGKACANGRRLNLIFAASYNEARKEYLYFDDPNILQAADVFTLGIPATAIKVFGKYISRLASIQRPLWSVLTKISMEPDPKTQFRLKFDLVNAPDSSSPLIPVLHTRALAEREAISFPFPRPEAPVKVVKKAVKKAPVKKAPAGKAAAKKGGKVPF